MDEILTIQEVAQHFKLNRTTVWRWCREGKLDAFRIGRGWRVQRGTIEKLVAQSQATYAAGAARS